MKESLVGTLKWIEGNGVVPAMDVEANARKNMSSLYRHADTTTRINVSNFASLHALQLLYNTLDQPYYSSKFSHIIISHNVYGVAYRYDDDGIRKLYGVVSCLVAKDIHH